MENRYANIVITGASSGLGRALSLWFSARGSRVYAAARRLDMLESLQKEASAGKGKVVPVQLDVTQPEVMVEKLRALDDATEGGIDLVIANAGVGGTFDPTSTEWPPIGRLLQVNVVGATATLMALASRMAQRRRGHLVGMSSVAAWIVFPRFGFYSATKRYLEIVCDSLRMDLASSGIRVTSIHPGFVKSEMTAKRKSPMPFLLETADAADRMGRAIVRGDTKFAFPWQMVGLTRLGNLLPRALVNRSASRGGAD